MSISESINARVKELLKEERFLEILKEKNIPIAEDFISSSNPTVLEVSDFCELLEIELKEFFDSDIFHREF